MSENGSGGSEREDKSVQRAVAGGNAATAGGDGGGMSPEQSLHQTRMNVTRQRRAAMRKGEGQGAPQVDIPEGGGKALDGGVKKSMEQKLGADLSGVKIHTGGDSAGAANKLNARAFTVGSDVHFNAGEFNPGSKEGTKLLAHELTHVVQGQKGGVQKKEDEGGEADAEGKDGEALEVSDPEEPAEKEADAVADKATEDMSDGGAEAEGKEAEAPEAGGDTGGAEAKAGGDEAEAPAAETEEKAPEAGAKLAAPISAKYSASALRKILRKKAFRDPDAATDATAEAAPPEAAAAETASAEAAPPEAASAEAAPEAAAAPETASAEAAPPEAASAETASAESSSAEAAPAEAPQEAAPTVAAKLKGIHRKVFRAGNDPGLVGGKKTRDDFAKGSGAGGSLSQAETAAAGQNVRNYNQMTLDQVAAQVSGAGGAQQLPGRSEREMLAAIESGQMPRYVARVGLLSRMTVGAAFGGGRFGDAPTVFATEPADVIGCKPLEAMLKVGWTYDSILSIVAAGHEVGVCVFDTEKAIQTDPADPNSQKKVGVGNFEWPQLIAKAKAHPAFKQDVTSQGIALTELDQIFQEVQNTPVGAAPASPKAGIVRKAMKDHLSANELYSGMGATVQESGKLGAREVALDNNGTNFKLTPDNHRAIALGKVKQDEMNALAATLNKPVPFPTAGGTS